MSTDTEKPYARCMVCDLVLPTPAVARQHGQDTMEPVTGEGVVTARGHRYRIENPTEEEIIESSVRSKVEGAISGAMDDLDRLVGRGHATSEQITAALRWYPDFVDAWEEYNRG